MPRENVTLTATNGAALSGTGALFIEGSDAPRAGAVLRTARERLGWALPDVGAHLRIGTVYLQALEDGRLDRTPGVVYALGYVKSYADILGLDPEDMARRFRAEAGQPAKAEDLVFPAPVAERGLPAGALILLGLILAGAAYIGWYRLSGEGRLPAETVAHVPARLATLAEQAVPGPDGRVPVAVTAAPSPRNDDDDGLSEPRQAASENPLLVPEPPPPPPPVELTRAPPFMGGTPTTAIAMPVTPPMRRREEAAQAEPAQSEGDGARVVLRFTGDTWVQIKERGGQTLVSKVMRSGEIFPVPTRPNLMLTTGNAGKVEVLVDGIPAPALGGIGIVRKDVPLEPDPLKTGAVVPVSTKR